MRTGKSNRIKRYSAGAVCLLLVLVLLLSALYVAAEVGHKCSGEECAVCAVIRWCGQILRNGGVAPVIASTMCAGSVSAAAAFPAVLSATRTQGTPVGDRVRLNN